MENKSNIKDNWEKVDKVCPTCNQVTERAKGITKQSMKRLFSFDYKNSKEWIWTIVIIGICFMAWSYVQDKKSYNDFMDHRIEYCTQLLSSIEYNSEGMNVDGSGLNGFGLNGLVVNNSNNTNPWITT